ncbi:hypothetical protein [Belnapia sp. F-4-1]|uniref:hypothetical protein n=1 Tax=Belnapia sp. F-4-1 TaxID=1545443 RepID=UPI00068B56F0|nr:hypothetical protein [Belnapia sp. F-4-1]
MAPAGTFDSPYLGAGSLSAAPNARNTLSTDLLLGRRLWRGAKVIVDASVTRCFGLSNSTGAAFPNNEAFRQTIALSGNTVPDDEDSLGFNEPMLRGRLTLSNGEFSVWGIFDNNPSAHDARTQFTNWALVGAGAFDFSADAQGWAWRSTTS